MSKEAEEELASETTTIPVMSGGMPIKVLCTDFLAMALIENGEVIETVSPGDSMEVPFSQARYYKAAFRDGALWTPNNSTVEIVYDTKKYKTGYPSIVLAYN